MDVSVQVVDGVVDRNPAFSQQALEREARPPGQTAPAGDRQEPLSHEMDGELLAQFALQAPWWKLERGHDVIRYGHQYRHGLTICRGGRRDKSRIRRQRRQQRCERGGVIVLKREFGHAAEPWLTWAILSDIEHDLGNTEAAVVARQRAIDA